MKHYRVIVFGLLLVLVAACVSIVVRPATTTSTPTPAVTAAATGASTPASPTAATSTLNVYYLDVGQGDSILLAATDFAILIDTGRQDRNEVVPYLRAIGITSLDLLVGTHPHADHIGQFPEVLRAFPVREVWMSGDENTTRTFEEAIDAVLASGAAFQEPRAGQTYQIGSARIEVLNPAHLTGEANEGSVGFRLTYGQVRFMFTGDAEAPTEREILESGRDLRAEILKLGHHGSNTSSSLAYVLAIKPEVAIWSAGVDNTYGHPHPETLERLDRLGITTYGTAESGTIVVLTNGASYRVETFAQGETLPAAPARPTPVAAPPTCRPGQVNVNTASSEELQRITQIGPARASLLIALRPYSSLDDLDRISGITPATVARIKAQGVACVD